MRKYIVVVMLATILVSLPAHANYFCQGTVTFLGLDPSGSVVVGGPGGIPDVYVCQLGATYNGFTPDSCKGIYATLLAAKTSGQQVQVYFNDSLTCSTHPSWAVATVNFVSTVQ